VVTTTTPTTAYRGAGRPEAAAAIERAVDLYAAEIGLDPVDVRRRNLVAASAFPYTTQVGTTYDSGNYERALDLVLEAAGYTQLRAEQARRRQSGARQQLGLGLSVYVEITGAMGEGEYGSIEVLPNGRALVKTGTSPHGQGHVTSWAMLASEQTGIPIDDIDVIHGDTDLVPRGIGTGGSRSLQQGGAAVNHAAVLLVEKARQMAAHLLEANPDDMVLDKIDGTFHVAGSPTAAKTWAELAVAAAEEGQGTAGAAGGDGADGPIAGGLLVETDLASGGNTFPFGAHLAVVEVDTDTGKATVVRMIAVDDAGRILNPMLVEGQVHGGLAQGVAQALLEEMTYDVEGNPTSANLADYTFISAVELPSFETIHMETPTPLNELGAKGIGESGTIGSTPAVQNAVIDAVAHLGVRHVDMPTTPERVWRAIDEARSAAR
jgi:carbon-monoxide dehydrogenase large subunit